MPDPRCCCSYLVAEGLLALCSRIPDPRRAGYLGPQLSAQERLALRWLQVTAERLGLNTDELASWLAKLERTHEKEPVGISRNIAPGAIGWDPRDGNNNV